MVEVVGKGVVRAAAAWRLKKWHIAFWMSHRCYYLVGLGGVLLSSIAAGFREPPYSQGASIASAFLFAFMGFVKPDRIYFRFVRAWRILSLAVIQFDAGLIDESKLVNAIRQGEALLGSFEESDLSRAEVTQANVGQPTQEPAAQSAIGKLSK